MGVKSKFKSFFLLDEEDYDMVEEEVYEEEPPPAAAPRKKNVVSLKSAQKPSKVVMAEPRVYAEAQEIADHLKAKKAVVVNLQRIQTDQARRIVDFLSGTVYAIGGEIQQIGEKIFFCAPENVEISGNITQFGQQDQERTGWQ
ncbi:cell division protein SepF [Domibacillus sp. PGB-M46]|uniref:cell division protein SepF n=1 Tax=Domibacillus sp. PGB-M46 TaxID=2910255 RepID=UPI001F5AE5AB|nr:cell division protein SepF [Domibacillus sp. PGB-M46]MCI2253186.1 cell division protein SepF [Domibacillus sp. PGB-M46]